MLARSVLSGIVLSWCAPAPLAQPLAPREPQGAQGTAGAAGHAPRSPVPAPDCDGNGVDDRRDIAGGWSEDCNGNGIPDACDLGSATLLAESFEAGVPAGWFAGDPWHVTDQCPRASQCDGSMYVYFGHDETCDFDDGDFFGSPQGSLISPPVAIPAAATSVELSFCSAYEGEGSSEYDLAQVYVAGQRAGEIRDMVSPTPQLDWERRRVDLSDFAGQTVQIRWWFNAMDGSLNNFLGWQVDDVRLTAFGIGEPATDCNQNGVLDECEPDCNQNGLPDTCEGADCNLDGLLDSCETSMGLSPDCNGNSIPDECDVEVSLQAALDNIAAAHTTITGFFPDTFNFLGGQVGTCIANGGISSFYAVFDCGNVLGTNLEAAIPYTGSTRVPSTAFGPEGRYFTAKHDGLFVMVAVDCEVESFHVSGLTAVAAGAVVDGMDLAVTVAGEPYRVYVKRIYDAFPASINQIVIVPGDGTGFTHSFPNDAGLCDQTVSGLTGIDRIVYALVSRQRLSTGSPIGHPLRPTDAQEIARELILAIPAPTSADVDDDGIPDECD